MPDEHIRDRWTPEKILVGDIVSGGEGLRSVPSWSPVIANILLLTIIGFVGYLIASDSNYIRAKSVVLCLLLATFLYIDLAIKPSLLVRAYRYVFNKTGQPRNAAKTISYELGTHSIRVRIGDSVRELRLDAIDQVVIHVASQKESVGHIVFLEPGEELDKNMIASRYLRKAIVDGDELDILNKGPLVFWFVKNPELISSRILYAMGRQARGPYR